MKARLNIQDNPSAVARQPVRAAYLRGGDLLPHLETMQRWGIPLLQLECYWVPEGIATRQPAGLLVILPAGRVPDDLLQPCTLLGQRLLIPVGVDIFPETNAAELDRVLHFPRVFWHPALGMVGFEASDRLDWAEVVTVGEERAADWGHGHPGLAPAPRLDDAKVLRSGSGGDIMDELKAGRGQRPLDDLGPTGNQDDSALGRFRDGLFKGALSMTRGLMSQFPEGQGEAGAGYSAFSKFADWLGRQLGGAGAGGMAGGMAGGGSGGSGGIQDRREDAIDKLMDLLRNNLEEALKYAIPLDNPFADRGVGNPGWDLHQRNTSFNWGNFGGTTSSGTWGMDGGRYQALRELYRKAANEALAAGDFEKAAYIFAHLLHDFSAAANALEQGRRFRDAAKIYRDYLKNIPAAAQCLERGGLYLEAIDIYLELKQWEKAGDLYKAMGLDDKAQLQYERCLEDFLTKNDYMAAAQFCENKLKRLDRTLTYLMLGWHGEQRYEACLRRYLELVNVPTVDMLRQISALWEKQTPYDRKPLFLEILADLQTRLRDQSVRDYSRELAYQYLSERVLAGDRSRLHRIRDFVTVDKLLPTDVSRFTGRQIHRPQRETFQLQLIRDVFWYYYRAVGLDNLSLGLKGNHLWLARWNWTGDVEYYHFTEVVPEDDRCLILPNHIGKKVAALLSPMGATYSTKHLAKGTAFKEAIEVASPAQIPIYPELMGGWMNAQQRLSLICKGSGDILCLRDMGLDGTLFSTVDLVDIDKGNILPLMEPEWIGEMVAVAEGHLGLFGQVFILLSDEGKTSLHFLDAPGRLFNVWNKIHLVYETDQGCFTCRADRDGLQSPPILLCGYNGTVMDLQYLANGAIVVAWENEIRAWETDEHGGYSDCQAKVEINGLVSSIIPGTTAERFLLQMTDGRLLPFRLESGRNTTIQPGW